jgi:hypothetical protein
LPDWKDALPSHHRFSQFSPALLACIFFVCAGYSFIPLLGVEGDEPLFAQGNFPPRYDVSLRVGNWQVPLMHMSYLGALKTWLFVPIVHWFGTSLYALRVPMVLLAGLGIWCFFLLLRRIAGTRAAVAGCFLLAADPVYLLTSVFDWGPVVLQHLLIIGGVLLLVLFYQTRQEGLLAAGCFLFGLVLWDKALSLWMMSGMAVAAAATLWRRILEILTRRRITVAAFSFLLGSLPLLIYNAQNHGATFQGNFKREFTEVRNKLNGLRLTANGSGMFGYMTEEDSHTTDPRPPTTALARVSARISAVAGHPREDLLISAFLLALLLAPFSGNVRAILFCVITMAVAWAQMAITANAGGSAHHTILLWPLPQAIIALSFAGVSQRLGRAGIPAVAMATAVVAVSGALVINEYYTVALRNGPAPGWSYSIVNLSRFFDYTPAKAVLCLDWGIMEPLRFLNAGRLPLATTGDAVTKSEMTPQDREEVQRIISDPADLFIGRTKEFAVFPGTVAKLTKFAEECGYQRHLLNLVRDNRGRAVFEVFHFVPAPE